MQRPEAYIDFAVYEDSVDLIGIANVTLPAITYMLVSITGAGVGGTVETPLAGMIDAMTMTMNFHSATGAAASLAAPKKHQIDLRAAEQHWNTTTVDKEVIADKYVMTIVPKSFSPGTIAPASASDASGEYCSTGLQFSIQHFPWYNIRSDSSDWRRGSRNRGACNCGCK